MRHTHTPMIAGVAPLFEEEQEFGAAFRYSGKDDDAYIPTSSNQGSAASSRSRCRSSCGAAVLEHGR